MNFCRDPQFILATGGRITFTKAAQLAMNPFRSWDN